MNGQKFTEIRRYLGCVDQIADARMVELSEGPGRGSRLIEFRNGSGLAFSVSPDRGMDLVDCTFQGIPLVFRTPNSYVSGERYEPAGNGWLRTWQGGLMTTCGLRNVGVPNGEFGQHGRASHLAAEDVGIRRGIDDGGNFRLEAVGTMHESCMFAEYLQLKRTIATAYGDNSITVCDTITNLATREEFLELLYHCNFGYPFASPELEFDVEPHDVYPRNEEVATGLDRWNKLEEPTSDYCEQCFFHKLPQGQIAILNRKLGIRIELSWNTDILPNFVEWKNCLTGGYALGLEPNNVTLRGRTADVADGVARRLAPGESVQTHLKFHFTTI